VPAVWRRLFSRKSATISVWLFTSASTASPRWRRARVKLQVADRAVRLGTHLRPAEVQLRLIQRVAVFLQRDVAPIVALAALDRRFWIWRER
jgi:hypothetical protein